VTPVTVGEVTSHAKPSCKSCHGSGVIAKWTFVNPSNQTRREQPCGCARKRFLKKHSEKLDLSGGEWNWQWKDAVAA
jgi:hypothetical protein